MPEIHLDQGGTQATLRMRDVDGTMCEHAWPWRAIVQHAVAHIHANRELQSQTVPLQICRDQTSTKELIRNSVIRQPKTTHLNRMRTSANLTMRASQMVNRQGPEKPGGEISNRPKAQPDSSNQRLWKKPSVKKSRTGQNSILDALFASYESEPKPRSHENFASCTSAGGTPLGVRWRKR